MIKKWAKSLLFRVIADLDSFLPFTRNCNIIVGLHKVVDSSMNSCWPSSPMKNFSMSSEFFRALIRKIKSEYDIIPVKELIIRTKNGRRNGLAAITFDDWYRDCYETAFPILKDMKVPASIYLSPSFIDNPQLPWEYLLENCLKDFNGKIHVDIHKRTLSFLINGNRPRYKTCIRLMSILTKLNKAEINRVMTQICNQTKYKPDHDSARGFFLTWDMAREMLSSGLIDFGNHGLNHLSLGFLSPQEIRKEILDSHNRIKEELGIEPVGFSFPYGTRKDYNDDCIKILKDNGYYYALTAENSALARNQVPFSLPRIPIKESEGVKGFQVRRSTFFRTVKNLLIN